MKDIKDYYQSSHQELKKFIDNDVLKYQKLRNYDFGPNKRNNVSNLSKYISHRIIFEFEIIKDVLKSHKLVNVEKFVQEVFWRIYWKGWLESRPQVWSEFINSSKLVDLDSHYYSAVSGKTKISFFNEWVQELKETNYLHNHTRMWFASIWIFSLNLPWQQGANFFLENLYDGDAASNILSWRWVAGLQTKGKHYIARISNIEKYSDKKIHNTKLNEIASPVEEFTDDQIQKCRSEYGFSKINKNLIIFENDLYFSDRINDYKSYEKIFLVFLKNNRVIKINKNVLNFKYNLITNFNTEFKNSEIIIDKNFSDYIKNFKDFDCIYPFIGETLDFVNKLKKEYNLNINFIYRKEDIFCWKYSTKGFFNFKKNIVKIIKELNLY